MFSRPMRRVATFSVLVMLASCMSSNAAMPMARTIDARLKLRKEPALQAYSLEGLIPLKEHPSRSLPNHRYHHWKALPSGWNL